MAKQIRTELVVKDKGTKEIKKFSKETVNAFKTIAGAAGIGAAIAGLTTLAKQTLAYGDQLGKLNKRLGVSVSEMDKLRKIGELSGVAFNTLSMAMQRMTRRVEDAAKGMGPAASALNEMGISAEKLLELRPDEQFQAIANRLAQVESKTRRVALAFKLFDSEGVSVLQMVEGLDKGMASMNSKWDKTKTKQVEDFNDQITKLKEGFSDLVTVGIMPTIKMINKLFATMNKEKSLSPNERLISKTKGQLEAARAQREELLNSRAPGRDRMLESNQKLIDRYKNRLKYFSRNKQKTKTGAASPDISGTTPVGAGAGGKDSGVDLAEVERLQLELQSRAVIQGKELAEQKLRDYIEMSNAEIEVEKTKQEEILTAQKDAAEKQSKILQDLHSEQMMLAERTKEFFATQVSDAFGDFITGAKGAKDAFRDFATSMLSDMARLAAQKAFSTLFASMGGGAGGSFFSGLGGILGLAGGGTAKAGKPYVVGERGPELFVPGKTGTVVPNGGGGAMINVNVTQPPGGGSSPNDAQRFGKIIGKQIQNEVRSVMAGEMRFGGMLNRAGAGGRVA